REFASTYCGFLANFSRIHRSVGSRLRSYIQYTRPSAKKFLQRSASRVLNLHSATAARVIFVTGTRITLYPLRVPSSSGLVLYFALFKSESSKPSELTTRM